MSIYMQLKYKTKLSNKEVLKQAFKEANIEYVEKGEELICDIGYYELHFKKNKNGEYEIKTHGYNDWKDDIKDFRDTITNYYNTLSKEQIQKQICNDIKSKVAKSSSMSLIQEETLDDNSIVLTISV